MGEINQSKKEDAEIQEQINERRQLYDKPTIHPTNQENQLLKDNKYSEEKINSYSFNNDKAQIRRKSLFSLAIYGKKEEEDDQTDSEDEKSKIEDDEIKKQASSSEFEEEGSLDESNKIRGDKIHKKQDSLEQETGLVHTPSSRGTAEDKHPSEKEENKAEIVFSKEQIQQRRRSTRFLSIQNNHEKWNQNEKEQQDLETANYNQNQQLQQEINQQFLTLPTMQRRFSKLSSSSSQLQQQQRKPSIQKSQTSKKSSLSKINKMQQAQNQESVPSERLKKSYEELTLDDLKVVEDTIKKNRQTLEKELETIQNQKKIKRQITLQPKVARKWEKVKNQLFAFSVMNKIFADIKKYGTSMQALSISASVIDRCKDLLQKRQIEKIPQNKLFYPDSFWLHVWMVIITIVYFITAIFAPYRIFFKEGQIEDLTGFHSYYDLTVRYFFIFDILVKINTVQVHSDGTLIENRKEIFKRYLKRCLILDIIQILPYDQILISFDSFDSLNIRRKNYDEILRIIRVPFLISEMTLDQKLFDYFKIQSRVQRIFRFLITVSFTLHIVGCIWTFIGKIQYGQVPTWIETIKVDINDDTKVYLFAIYWCLQTLATVGYGDVHASNDYEVSFTIFWMVMGAGVYSFTVGQLSKMFTDSESRNQKLSNSIYIMDEFCEQTHLPNSIKQNVRQALQYASSKSILNKQEKEHFFNVIPIKLRTGLAKSMFKGTITNVPFLKKKDSLFLSNLLPMLHPLKLQKGDYVYKKDQYPNLVYFIIEGKVNFLVGPFESTFKSFLAGSYFGEIEIFHQCLRMFSVRCQDSCQFLTLDRDYLGDIMDKFPNVESEMYDMVEKRRQLIDQSLNQIQMLLPLSDQDNFWKNKETKSIKQIINEMRKNQTKFLNHREQKKKETQNKNTIQQIQQDEVLQENRQSSKRKVTILKRSHHQTYNQQSSNPSIPNKQDQSSNNKDHSNLPKFQNQVVLNVFDENKQPMLVEVYHEELKLPHQSQQAQDKNFLNLLSIDNPRGEVKLAKLQQKYGMSTLDCIEEKNSRMDLENNSYCAVSDMRDASPFPNTKNNQMPNFSQANEYQNGTKQNDQFLKRGSLRVPSFSQNRSNQSNQQNLAVQYDLLNLNKQSDYKNPEGTSNQEMEQNEKIATRRSPRACSIVEKIQPSASIELAELQEYKFRQQQNQQQGTEQQQYQSHQEKSFNKNSLQIQINQKNNENSFDKSFNFTPIHSVNSSFPQITVSLDPQQNKEKDISKISNVTTQQNKTTINIESLQSFQDIAMIDSSPEFSPHLKDKQQGSFHRDNSEFKRSNKTHKSLMTPSTHLISQDKGFHSHQISLNSDQNINIDPHYCNEQLLTGGINPFQGEINQCNQRMRIQRNYVKKGLTEVPRSHSHEIGTDSEYQVNYHQKSSDNFDNPSNHGISNSQIEQINIPSPMKTSFGGSNWENQSQASQTNEMMRMKKTSFSSRLEEEIGDLENQRNSRYNSSANPLLQQLSNQVVKLSTIRDTLSSDDDIKSNTLNHSNPLAIMRKQRQISRKITQKTGYFEDRFKLLKKMGSMQSNQSNNSNSSIHFPNRSPKNIVISPSNTHHNTQDNTPQVIPNISNNLDESIELINNQMKQTYYSLSPKHDQYSQRAPIKPGNTLTNPQAQRKPKSQTISPKSDHLINQSLKIEKSITTSKAQTQKQINENKNLHKPSSNDNNIIQDDYNMEEGNKIKYSEVDKNVPMSLSHINSITSFNKGMSLKFQGKQSSTFLSLSPKQFEGPINAQMPPLKISDNQIDNQNQKVKQRARNIIIKENGKPDEPRSKPKEPKSRRERVNGSNFSSRSRTVQRISSNKDKQKSNDVSLSSSLSSQSHVSKEIQGQKNKKSLKDGSDSCLNFSSSSDSEEIENIVQLLTSKIDYLMSKFEKILEVVASLSQEIRRIKISINNQQKQNKFMNAKSFTFKGIDSAQQRQAIFLPPSISLMASHSKNQFSITEDNEFDDILSQFKQSQVITPMQLRSKHPKLPPNFKDTFEKLKGNESDKSH